MYLILFEPKTEDSVHLLFEPKTEDSIHLLFGAFSLIVLSLDLFLQNCKYLGNKAK